MKKLGVAIAISSISFATGGAAADGCVPVSVTALMPVLQKTYSNIKVLAVTCSPTGSTIYISTSDGNMQIQCTPAAKSDYSPTDLTTNDNFCAGSTYTNKYLPLKQRQ